jgi:hypothetical protein
VYKIYLGLHSKRKDKLYSWVPEHWHGARFQLGRRRGVGIPLLCGLSEERKVECVCYLG